MASATVSVSAVKHDKQHSSAGRLDLRLQDFHSGLSHRTIAQWFKTLVCEFARYSYYVTSVMETV